MTHLPVLLHFSYHKCLTVYFSVVMKKAFYSPIGRRDYIHLKSRVDLLPETAAAHRLTSVNNHHVDLTAFHDPRATRFVRDPRDLLVSGYFYHQRGTEVWTRVRNPTEEDWRVVNGTIPDRLPRDRSFQEYLNEADLEAGMLAELDFRRAHFDSMARWDLADPRVLLITYDEVMADHVRQFDRVLDHYGLSPARRAIGRWAADRYSAARKAAGSAHVRNPESGQWRRHLPESVLREFERRHGELIPMYGFARD